MAAQQRFSDDPSIRPHMHIRTPTVCKGPSAQAGLAEVSAGMLHAVEKHTANIGAEVSKLTLQRLEQRLLDDAKELCYAKKWDQAIHAFTHALAVCEKLRSPSDLTVRAAIVHNLGYSLHCLGEFDAAKEYYEEALAYFRSIKTPALERWTVGLLHGDVNQSRILFIKERLLDLSFGRAPEDEYLDEFGRKRPMPTTGSINTPSGGSAAGAATPDGGPSQSFRARCELGGENNGHPPPRAWATRGDELAGVERVPGSWPGWLMVGQDEDAMEGAFTAAKLDGRGAGYE
jgi:tetratricopeptide (TPR) repeat protein